MSRNSAQLKLIHPSPKFNWKSVFGQNFIQPYYETDLGVLFEYDSLKLLPLFKENTIDTVFADPPFNIGKVYRESTNDKKPDHEYIEWSKIWIRECVRILKPGGSLFLYNLPKWNIIFGSYLLELGMDFRHWIAIELSLLLPIQGRLYPSHYSLIYYSKGKPNTFRKIRTPIELCRHCKGEIKDYGGHRKAMNPNGVNLKDIWTDVPPVRHKKFKSSDRKANALSTKVTDRVIEMSTLPGGIILDPFGGSGTTYVSCENKKRHWIGIEIDYADDIKNRLETFEIHPHKNIDFIEG
jgi:site-specific DNA-methyltransferase (adenine-specific)